MAIRESWKDYYFDTDKENVSDQDLMAKMEKNSFHNKKTNLIFFHFMFGMKHITGAIGIIRTELSLPRTEQPWQLRHRQHKVKLSKYLKLQSDL